MKDNTQILFMNNQIILPPKYYLTHFQEFLSHLESYYHFCLGHEHVDFLRTFAGLSEDAQCLYIRMVNRKGRYFYASDFHYAEIDNTELGMKELFGKKFARKGDEKNPEDRKALIQKSTKPQLCQWLTDSSVDFKKSSSVKVLRELALSSVDVLPIHLFDVLIIQEQTDIMEYLLFLFFGELRDNLNLYTLRDLGVRQKGPAPQKIKPRFGSREEALSLYQYALMWKKHEADEELPPFEKWPLPLCSTSRSYRDSLLLSLGEIARQEENPELALEYWKECRSVPAREKQARLHYQLGEKEECRLILDQILENPWSDEECFFAEDFFARKFEQKKIGLLTQTLREARKIEIDESYFRHPELGVIHYLEQEGTLAIHAENGPWNALFGLTFWHLLFEGDLLHNEFERIPMVLLTGEFSSLYHKEISGQVGRLDSEDYREEYFTQICSDKKGHVNGIFTWYPDLESELKLLLKAPWKSLSEILLKMAQSYTERSSGFPDLLVHKDNKVSFIEVKATGDSLRQSQFAQLMIMKRAGLVVDVLQVDYKLNENQLYVVVDLETTGLGPAFHRITEIGAVKIKGKEIIDTFQTLVNPGRSIPRNIQQLTGITDAMVADAPRFEEIAESFAKFSEGAIFVAHNVNFDYQFLQHEYSRLEQRFVRPFICTKAGMKKYYPENSSFGLGSLSEKYAISLTQHHRALNDASAAAQLLLLINQKRKELAHL
jgi:DNA polymerase-3 subunit epsilon